MYNSHFQAVSGQDIQFQNLKVYADLIYKKVRRQIPGKDEIARMYPEKRPDSEAVIIYSVIYEFIHVDNRGRDSTIYLVDPNTNKPGILLKMVRKGMNYMLDEGTPIFLQSFGLATLTLGGRIAVATEWTNYYKKLSNRTSSVANGGSKIAQGRVVSKLMKYSGTVLKVAGKVLDRVGQAALVYDILSVDSPSMITNDTIIEATKNQISKLCQKLPPYNL